MDPKDWLSSGQAARLAGIGQQWVNQLAKQGRLEHIETPLGILIRREAVEEYARLRAEKLTNRAAHEAVA